MSNEPDTISETEAAKLLPFSKTKLQRFRRAGKGPPHYDFGDGGKIHYYEEEVIEWREKHYRDPQSRQSAR